ncbi:MAG: LolA family protein [Flavobacteriales bacterium]
MKNKILIAVFLFSQLISFGQDEKAEKILKDLSANTKSYSYMDVDFDFNFINTSQDINESQKGNIKINQNKFRLDLNQQLIISDDSIQWIYLKESNELQIMEYDSQDEMISPNKLFTIYENGYKSQYIELKENNHIIDLFPIESNEFKNIQLHIDQDKIQLKKIILFDKKGGSFSYLITKFISDKEIDENAFRFNEANYPDLEIIDLR